MAERLPRGPIEPEPVAIVGGSGALGHGVAVRLAGAGARVAIGSRDASRAADAAARVRAAVPAADVAGLANAEAAAAAEVVLLCVPFASQSETLKGLREALQPGQVIVDATVPLAPAVGGRPTRTLGVWQGSAAQQARELVPEGVAVVSALHTVSAAMLADLDHRLDEDVLVCGDDKPAKRRAMALLELIPGLRAVDCGPLDQARIVESLTALLIGVNARYKTHAGIRLTGLPASPAAPN